MKSILFAMSYVMTIVLMQYSWLTAMTEEQFKQEIAACWNEHEKTMQNLKVSFQKEEQTTKEVVSKVLPSEEKSTSAKEFSDEPKESQAKVDKDVEAEVVESAVVIEDKQESIESNTQEVQKERVYRSKALQSAELELKPE